MITIRNFEMAYGKKVILKNASIAVKKGEVTLLTGKSGAGKTTLLNLLSLNIIDPKANYEIAGQAVAYSDKKQINEIHQKYFSYVFQDYSLFSSAKVKKSFEISLAMENSKYALPELLRLVQLEE